MSFHRVAVCVTALIILCGARGVRGQETCDESSESVSLGDSQCDSVYNTPECDYDLGDCCSCTCSGSSCGVNGFDCLDPAAANPLYDCDEIPSEVVPCRQNPTTWIVGNTAQAYALAEAVKCSGGVFDVEWKGNVSVNETISIANGTVLSMTGAGVEAVVHGGGTIRPFTVVNASLNLKKMSISYGFGIAGGAIAASGASLTFDDTAFIGNSALIGGALFVSEDSVGIFYNETSFVENNATSSGGALYVSKNCSLYWSGKSTFIGNNASVYGGALYTYENSAVSFDANVSFSNNIAGNSGGAMHVAGNASVAMNGVANFDANKADTTGGGISVIDVGSSVYWSQAASFTGNQAYRGGVLYIHNGGRLSYTGPTKFVLNSATKSGGVLGSGAFSAISNYEESLFFVRGPTSFENNTAGGNGGGIALLGMLNVEFEATEVTFYGNTADVAGGAIFISGTGVAPILSDMTFTSNSAKVGGAVYAVASGVELTEGNANPTTFARCSFVGNKAVTTGGAVESAAGRDTFVSSTFVRNEAGLGGALRLAGTVTVDNCSFVGNIADEGSGAAVSNVGYIDSVNTSTFLDNVFSCEAGTFLDFEDSGDLYGTVCLGCPKPCLSCRFAEPERLPKCSSAVEYSSSPGGIATVEELIIDAGHWRATNISLEVLTCHNTDACHGGTTGAIDFCNDGYEGPYCAICSEGYTGSLGLTCNKCSGSTSGTVLAAITGVIAVLALAVVASYLVSGKHDAMGLGLVHHILRFIPLQPIKIVVVAWQILTQFASVANLTYPDVYERFLNIVDAVNFDLSWAINLGCIMDIDFHDRLLIATISPFVGLGLLGATYAIADSRHRWSDAAVRMVRRKHASAVLLLTFLVYSSVSSVVFQMFSCEILDDGKTYLRADYRIQCDSPKHVTLQFYAAAMVVVYPVGIPVLYAILLLRDREALQKTDTRKDSLRVQLISGLWEPYRPSRYYYDVIECARRVLLAGVTEFISSDSGAQVSITIVIAFIFFGIAEVLRPYHSKWDSWTSRSGHVIVFMSLYVALLVEVDVSDKDGSSQKVFETILVFFNACLILAVVVEAIVLAASLRTVSLEKTFPRFRRTPSLFLTRSMFVNGENPFASPAKVKSPPVHLRLPFAKPVRPSGVLGFRSPEAKSNLDWTSPGNVAS